ncbi:Gfo/Idh/MocA family oxidoreductase [Spirochaetia bacterium 38H-sp]|uniref:Gfo/Idh/MocA family oxidoreductase n=1 Tax=Rarispira pelagica TaxID=3141764 RepID=A0ABU9UC41_9SPIR
MDFKPVKWGVLGVSGHYRLRINNPMTDLEEEGIVEKTAIASRDIKRAKEAAEEMGFKKAYGSYSELLEDKDIEAVYIPLPNHMHKEYVKMAADNGKHILCEKPLTMDLQDTIELVEYTKKKGVILMEAFMYRLHPQWEYAKRLIKAGEIGKISSIHVAFFYNNPDPSNIRNKKETGGGAIPDIGCYAVSCARFLAGTEPKRVISLVNYDKDSLVDTLSSGILDFGEMRSVFTVGTRTFNKQQVQVYGSSGYLEIDVPFNTYPDVPGKIRITTSVGTRTVETQEIDQYGIEFSEFSFAIRENTAPPILPEDAVANQKVLDALFLSSEKNSWITLD